MQCTVLCGRPGPCVWLQLRDPVDRVLSAYEFANEVAARVLWRAKDYVPDPDKMSTRNVWPWTVLVPPLEATMVERVSAGQNQRLPTASPHSLSFVCPPGPELHSCHPWLE